MKINDKILKRINELKEDVELYLSDYGIWKSKEFEIDPESYDDAVEVELTIKTDWGEDKTINLYFKVNEEKTYLMAGEEHDNEEEVNGETLWRALFFEVI